LTGLYQLLQIDLNGAPSATFRINGAQQAVVSGFGYNANTPFNLALQNGGSVNTQTDYVSVCTLFRPRLQTQQ